MFGLIVLSHNMAPSLERLAMSLHNQKYSQWRAYCLDFGSTDRAERLMWVWNKTVECPVLHGRFSLHPLPHPQDERCGEELRTVLSHIVRQVPAPLYFGIMRATDRLDHDALEVVQGTFRLGGADLVQGELIRGTPRQTEQEEGSRGIPFMTRKLLERSLETDEVKLTIRGNLETFHVDIGSAETLRMRAGQKPIGQWF